MAKKGLLTVTYDYAKHLRKWGKRMFWKRERKAANADARKQAS